ncbi:hypothetical protein SCALM49S_08330 [Streptomyces californicus]
MSPPPAPASPPAPDPDPDPDPAPDPTFRPGPRARPRPRSRIRLRPGLPLRLRIRLRPWLRLRLPLRLRLRRCRRAVLGGAGHLGAPRHRPPPSRPARRTRACLRPGGPAGRRRAAHRAAARRATARRAAGPARAGRAGPAPRAPRSRPAPARPPARRPGRALGRRPARCRTRPHGADPAVAGHRQPDGLPGPGLAAAAPAGRRPRPDGPAAAGARVRRTARAVAGRPQPRLEVRAARSAPSPTDGRPRPFLRSPGPYGRLPGIAVEAPHECDAGMQRDGVAAVPPAGRGERSWWLGQLVEATPLDVWEERFGGRAAEEVVALPMADEWAGELHAAWCRAAVRQRNPHWSRALLGRPSAPPASGPGRPRSPSARSSSRS